MVIFIICKESIDFNDFSTLENVGFNINMYIAPKLFLSNYSNILLWLVGLWLIVALTPYLFCLYDLSIIFQKKKEVRPMVILMATP